jgi:hypothetical protein
MSALPYRWTGKVMEPENPHLCNFVVGNTYWLEKDRSEISHRHEFAWIREAWKNLPEDFAEQFTSPEALRKAALLQAGYFNETIIDVGNAAGAERVAAYLRFQDEFAHVVVRRGVIVVRTAKSQSRKNMSPAEFNESKRAILEVVSAMIGIMPEDLQRNSDRAA